MAPEWTHLPVPPWPAPTLWQLLVQRAKATPRADAVWASTGVDAPERWSYADLHAAAARMARRLSAQHGVTAGDRVAWLGLNQPFALVLLFALARLGALWVPLNHRLAPAEWAAVLADCQPRTLFHDASLAPAARELARASGLSAWEVPADVRPGEAAAPFEGEAAFTEADSASRPVLLVYTSGTTGAPKAAVHTQANLLANMAIAAQVQQLTAADTVLSALPLFHVGGLCLQTLPALAVGACVLLHDRFDPARVLQAIATERPTLTLQVPATLQALTQHPQWPHTNLTSLHAVWAGSSLLPEATLQAFHARGVPVCNVYGSTETGPFSIALPPEHAASHLGACGWPAPGVAVKLCDPQGRPVAHDAVGEICLRAPNVVAHYWPDHPAQDAEGFFHSGDLARQAPDGSFTVVGRAKDMIISGGENIYPAEIENLIAQHPAVAECCVFGQADARWGEVAVAVLVLREPARGEGDWAAALQAWLDGRLARYKWPRRWVLLDALPRTALGKVQKAELRRQVGA